MSTPRIFVSSVVDGFQDIREAARRGILAAGAEPVLVNEDLPASPESSRNACLDAIDSVDALVLIIGARGGWTTPSGKLVVEEEYEHAVNRRLPILVFVQDVARDADATRLCEAVFDYVDGVFRRAFKDPRELELLIATAVHNLAPSLAESAAKLDATFSALTAQAADPNNATLRMIVVPERSEEVISPMELESTDFINGIYELGHLSPAPLFSWTAAKRHRIAGDQLHIEQRDVESRHDAVARVWLSIDERGIIALEANVSNRRSFGMSSTAGAMTVALPDITSVLQTFFGFVGALFDRRDAYKRHLRFRYNVALLNLGFREIVREVVPRNSYTMNVHRSPGAIVAFDAPRLIHRADVANPAAEIARVATVVDRAARDH